MTPSSKKKPVISLNLRSTLVELLRTLFGKVVGYCALDLSHETGPFLLFSQEQLVSLIERSSPDTAVFDIPGLVDQGVLKPFPAEELLLAPDPVPVLLVGQKHSETVLATELLTPKEPSFPQWWEAPLPFVLFERGTIWINSTAALMFGSDIKRIDVGDVSEKDEFLVMLENAGLGTSCSIMFRRLEGDVFLLEDMTDDVAAAEDITWWAAVGKAWAAKLDERKRSYWRCEALEPGMDGATVFPCEWGGKTLGYFCVKAGNSHSGRLAAAQSDEEKARAPSAREKKKAESPVKKTSTEKKKSQKSREASGTKAKKEKKESFLGDDPKNKTLSVLGPQTMGMLAPGTNFVLPDDEFAVGEVLEPQESLSMEKASIRKRGRPRKNAAQENAHV